MTDEKEELRRIIREELLKMSNGVAPYCEHKWGGYGYTFGHQEICLRCGTIRPERP
jgi:hypothetical protein